MPLVPATLASSLANDWLVSDGEEHPSSVMESGQRFARAVAEWFAQAMAGGFPCSTAMARQSQLSASAASALSTGDAAAAGSALALGLLGYMAGQCFGPGVASAPMGVSAAQSTFIQVFQDHDSPNPARAQTMATAIHTLALTTLVVFPPVISPPQPVT